MQKENKNIRLFLSLTVRLFMVTVSYSDILQLVCSLYAKLRRYISNTFLYIHLCLYICYDLLDNFNSLWEYAKYLIFMQLLMVLLACV